MQFQIPENISDEIFAILTREENEALIDRIADEHQLREDQVSLLSGVIGLAIMGAIPLKNIAEALGEELDIGLTEAKRATLSILLNIVYPFWPLFPDIDEVITDLGGKVLAEKPAMPRLTNNQQPTTNDEIVVTYPSADLSKEPEKPELLGGLEIPVPPVPRATNDQRLTTNNRILERDVPWTPMAPTTPSTPLGTGNDQRLTTNKTVARPGDVVKLLEKNLLQKRQEAEPRVKGNVVDLSN